MYITLDKPDHLYIFLVLYYLLCAVCSDYRNVDCNEDSKNQGYLRFIAYEDYSCSQSYSSLNCYCPLYNRGVSYRDMAAMSGYVVLHTRDLFPDALVLRQRQKCILLSQKQYSYFTSSIN
jgi:hypothetical protein